MAKATKKKAVQRPPDLVRVRVISRAFHPLPGDPDNPVIWNEGEVLDIDTARLKAWDTLRGDEQDDSEKVVTANGEFALPKWATLVKKSERVKDDDLTPKGHQAQFGKAPDGKSSDDVI